MKLRVFAAGKPKDAALRTLVEEYVKRSSRFQPLEVTHLRDASAIRGALESSAAPRVLLDERGEQPSTRELAGWLERWRDQGTREVCFFVGDADGFTEAERGRADRILSLSRLTLPHRVALLVLAEQLYRAASLLAGHPYHRD